MGAPPDQRTLSDDEAFARDVLPEVEVLLRVAVSRTGNAADAEDLVQDTLPETTLARLHRFGQVLATHGPPDAPAGDADRGDPG